MGNPTSAPSPTPHPTTKPPTAPTHSHPTASPTTAEPTPKPTPSPTCPGNQPGVPQLGVTIANMAGAGTASDVYASILVGGKKDKKADWSDWQLLKHAGCNNLVGEDGTAWFNEWHSEDSQWWAVAFYNCGDDDAILSAVSYWDGEDQAEVSEFCSNVAGPTQWCAFDQLDTDYYGVCYNGYDSPVYDHVRLNPKGQDCHSMAFYLGTLSSKSKAVAAPWYKTTPGVPECVGASKKTYDYHPRYKTYEAAHVSHGVSGFTSESEGITGFAGLAQVDIVAVLVAILLTFCLVYTYFKRKYTETMYKKLPDDPMEETGVTF